MTRRSVTLVALTLLAACGDDLKPDVAAPVVTLEAPTEGAEVEPPVIVRGTVTDPKVKGRKTSGVATVEIDGRVANVSAGRFELALPELAIGPASVVVTARDKAGNVGEATVAFEVSPPVTGLLVEPPILTAASTTVSVQLTVTGFFEGSGSRGLVEGLTFEVEDPELATVDASGRVLAASDEASGTTTVTVGYRGLTATATVNVRLDTEPPGPPSIVGYAKETAHRDQTWTGFTEPEALVTVAGAAEPVSTTADVGGRFWLNVPLEPNALNELAVTVTDRQGNASRPWPFPVLQNDGLVDAGTLHLSSARRVKGFVGELLAEPLAVRAYDAAGAPLPGASVTLEVLTGEGGLLPVEGAGEAQRALTILTDGAGYARARWRLGRADFDLVEVHARLAGDTGFPVVFQAEGFARLDQETAITGVAYDEQRLPVPNLPVTLLEPGTEYASETRGQATTTDERGRFRIALGDSAMAQAPHTRHLRFDGTTLPEGARYVRIDTRVTLLPGQEADVGTFWIPHLPEGVKPALDASGVVTEALVLSREIIPGQGEIHVHVPVGTKITWPGGVPESARKLTLLAIPESRTPMSLPDGYFSREVLALQPGGTRFEPPLPLDLPNSAAEPPGAALTLWSYDHFQSEFVPIGRGIVSPDGTRVLSEPGSGIRVGAWHKASPPVPPPPCTVKGQVITSKVPGTPPKPKKKQKCKCYIEGTDQATDCPEDKDDDGKPDEFVITNIPGCLSPSPPPPPNPPPNEKPKPKPPVRKVEVVCEEEPLEITNPSEIKTTIKKGETIGFTAECKDGGKSNGSIKWQRSGPGSAPKTGSGPRFTVRFDEEGQFVVSASANTKTCKGNDQRTVKVISCAEAGVVRVCGDKIEQVGPTSDNRFQVSGNVRAGLKGSGSQPGSTNPEAGNLYLQISQPMLVDPAGARPLRATTVQMEVGYPVVGTKLTPIVYESELTISPTGLIQIQPFADDSFEGVPFRLLQFALQFSEMQMLTDGVFLKNPNLELFKRTQTYNVWTCPKPKIPDALDPAWREEYRAPPCKPEEFTSKETKKAKDLQIVVDGVELTADFIRPTGYFEWKPSNALGDPGLDLGTPFFKLMGIKVGYQKQRFTGDLALQMSLARYDLGIKTTVSIGEGYFAGELGLTFSGFSAGAFELPGIPILPALLSSPVYLSSIGLAYESSSWPVTDAPSMKLTGKAGVTFGPQLTLFNKKVALAKGDLSMTLVPYPLAFGFKGDLSLLAVQEATGINEVKLETPTKLSGTFDVAFEPNFQISLGGTVEQRVPKLFGLEVTDPFFSGSLKGSLLVQASDGDVVGNMMGSVSYQIPKTKFTPQVTVLQGQIMGLFKLDRRIVQTGGSVSFSCLAFTCTVAFANDPVNGMSIWLQTNKGDFVQLYGLNPNSRVALSAPSLGVSRATPMRLDYDGEPTSFELLEPAETLVITLEKEPGLLPGALTLPSGEVIGPTSNPAAFEARIGVDFDEGLDGRTATWTVYDAVPGTYTYVGLNDRTFVHGLTAFIPEPPPDLAFAEPFARTELGLMVTWDAAPGDGELALLAVPEGDDKDVVELGTFPVGPGAFELDEAELGAARDYRLVAVVRRVGSFVTTSREAYRLGLEPAVDPAAPSLVEVSPVTVDAASGEASLRVSWLPGEGATTHVVTLRDGLGETVATARVPAPTNHADLRFAVGSSLETFGGGEVIVEAQAELERASVRVEVPREPRSIFAEAPPAAVVGELWRHRAAEPSSRSHPVVLAAGPPGIAVAADGTITWTPTPEQVGPHTLVLRLGSAPHVNERRVAVEVHPAGTLVAPSPVAAPEARQLPAVVGAELAFEPRFQRTDSLDDQGIALELVGAPDGATLVDGRVTWTPTAPAVIAARGRVPMVIRATSAGLTTEATWTLVFADRDGDGLDDAWELASGADPDAADDLAADPDGDGLDQRGEARFRTRGDLADSDGDGRRDGLEVTRTAPPDGYTQTSDPRLADRDGDGLADGRELADGTDPEDADSDGDGVADGVEVDRGFDPKDGTDGDGDGLADDRERVLGTRVDLADSDGDGLDDSDEVEGFVRPNGTRCSTSSHPLLADGDQDGVDDLTEVTRCDGLTSPSDPGVDSDGDGLRSDRERVLGTSDARPDTDGDGVDDPIEVIMGTSPTDPSDAPPEVETEPNELVARTGESASYILAPESLTDFGVILVLPDADRDTATDDYELLYDYDPESATDATSDDDGDGLPMWQEARIGSSPRAVDTDGDGVADGQELQDGTDPTDADDFSTAGPVTAVTLYPRRAALSNHVFLGFVQRQLALVGTRADGSTVDLTPTARGTSYVVTPAAAGTVDASGMFTGAPGYVGEAEIRADNLALSSTSALTLESFAPGAITTVPLGGNPTALAAAEGEVLVGGPWGVRAFDVSKIETPVEIGAVALEAAPVDLALDARGGRWVAAALEAEGVAILERGSPPVLRALVPTRGACAGVAWADGRVLAATTQGLVRISPDKGIGLVDGDGDGADDRVIDTQSASASFTSVSTDLDRAVAARADGRLISYRLVSGGLIQELDLSPGATASRVSLRGGLVTGATGNTASRLVLGPGATWRGSATFGQVLYTAPVESFVLATESTSGTVVFLDARGEAPLTTLGSVDFDAFYPRGLAVDRRYFYLADGYNGRLHIGSHNPLYDTLGVPPVVTAKRPLAGATLTEGTPIPLEVEASDDVAVKTIVVTRDGVEVADGATSPLALGLRTSNVDAPTTMTVGAFALDYGGNVGVMAPLVFEVTPVVDTTPPSVVLREPSDEEFVGSGSPVTVAVEPADDHAVYAVEVRLGGELVETLYDAPWLTEVTMPALAEGDRVPLTVTAIDYGDNRSSATAELVLGGRDLVAEGVFVIGPDDASLEDQDILIRQGTVSITGPHTFGKVRVGRNGVLTHADVTAADDSVGLDLSCVRLDVAPTGVIDVSGRGYLGDCSTGDNSCGGGPHTEGNVQVARGPLAGGSHGGVGGNRAGPTYGSLMAPVSHGGGGDYGASGGDPGGDGGGRVRVVAEEVALEGLIRANGGNAPELGFRRGSGGAGGSVWITARALKGRGRVEANGGFPASGALPVGGSPGGGGRVSVEVGALDLPLGNLRAYPGGANVGPRGGAGTVWVAREGERPRLVVDDGWRGAGVDDPALSWEVSSEPLTFDAELVVGGSSVLVLTRPLEVVSLELVDAAVLTHPQTDAAREHGLEVRAERVSIGAGARIDVSGRGFLGDCSLGDPSCGGGPHAEGNVQIARGDRAGGAHGGVGGGATGPTYGDLARPFESGGGGNYGAAGGDPGGDGGGRVKIEAAVIEVDGRILAEGDAAPETGWRFGGGGAGGAIQLLATSVTGLGSLSADGGVAASGDAPVRGGAGGGGRVAVVAEDLASTLALSARPAVSRGPGREGGAGTVWLEIGASPGRVFVDDGERSAGVDNRALGWAPSDAPLELGDLYVRGASRLVATRPLEAREVHLEGGAVLTHLETTVSAEHGLTVVAERMVIGARAAVDVSGRGYLGDCAAGDPSCGAGSHGPGNDQAKGAGTRSGGSHGGRGGGALANATYGDLFAPIALGTGGGYGRSGSQPGLDGGGRVRLVLGALALDGAVRANGEVPPAAGARGGGGAGGSLWITVGALSGAGHIEARGGASDGLDPAYQAVGGGGRVAVEYTSSTLDEAHITAWPGFVEGLAPASAGTVFLRRGVETGRLIVDDGGLGRADSRSLGFDTGTQTLVIPAELILRGTTRLELATPIEFAALRLEGESVLTHVPTSATYEGGLTVKADSIYVGPDARIDVVGRGYLGDCAPGDPSCGARAHTLGNAQTGGAGQRSGGGHGGLGAGVNAGFAYGDPRAPATLGAGGGYGQSGNDPGVNGGGRIALTARRVEIDGLVSAAGANASQGGSGAGGGAGGSVRIEAEELGGSGRVSVIGGLGGIGNPVASVPPGGGGGGGRVALSWARVIAGEPLELARVAAHGGVGGAGAGGPGTVWLDGPGVDRLVVDNGGVANGNETAPWVEVGAYLVSAVTADGIEIASSPWRVDALAGAEVELGAQRFTVTSNSANALVLEPASGLAQVAVGAALRGVYDLPGALEIVGGARVALADRAAAETLLVGAGAVVTHRPAMTGGVEPGLYLDIREIATVAVGGAIDVSARGYLGDCHAGDDSCGGGAHTLGFAQSSGARQYSGGSHGGLGGDGAPGFVFGDPLAPSTLGGGGGYGGSGNDPGARGGGRVRLVAGALVVDGQILADGGAVAQNFGAGGGAGGSIWLDADALGGQGEITARGGAGGGFNGRGGGGGGGRVAIVWGQDVAGDPFDVDAVEVHGGAGGTAGGPGTLWLAPAIGDHRLIVDNGGADHPNEAAPWVEVGLRTVTAADARVVTLTGTNPASAVLVGRPLVFGEGTTRFVVAATTPTTLGFAAGDASGLVGQLTRSTFALAGRLELGGGARVALVDRLEADGLVVSGGAVLSHPATFEGMPDQGLWLDVDEVAVEADGLIDVSARGYRGECAPGAGSCGGGARWLGNAAGGARQSSGGSSGGLGGGPSPNPVYGALDAPYWLGAGGGYGLSGWHAGGAGGGRVLLMAVSLRLDGAIRADGQAAPGTGAGGGAGGGVDLTAGALTGGGGVSARGGAGGGDGGGGGGGRVRVVAPGVAGPAEVGGGASTNAGRLGASGSATRL